ncbi:MAG: response regulator [Gammaproteobacteria bacterium]|nr:response regulator [Gammaproteobacteria bacterium]
MTEKRGTVLFVDDERRVLSSMRAMFRRDYEVLLANSGAEALDLLRDQTVDVIVSDQRMPGMTGVEVLKQVKALAPASMRILLTGYADLKAIEASINEGEVFRYLTKPCPADELKAAVGLAADVARQAQVEAQVQAQARAAEPASLPPRAAAAVVEESADDEFIELLPVHVEPLKPRPTAAPVDLSQRRAAAELAPVPVPVPKAVPAKAVAPSAPPLAAKPLIRPRAVPSKRQAAAHNENFATSICWP